RHSYSIRLDWTGNQGTGTSAYRAYSRAHEISAQGKTAIAGSSDPVFRGDAARWNPAELLIAALSPCHQLWYLHLCADARIPFAATPESRLWHTAMTLPAWRSSGRTAPDNSKASRCGRTPSSRPALMRHRAPPARCRRREMLYRALCVVQGRARTHLRDCVGV